jgi:hypothetical protein
VQIALPYTHIFRGVGDPIEEEDQMIEFRLLFQGLVRPTANKGHPVETHAIRRDFHLQLRHLWDSRPGLRQLAEQWSLKEPNSHRWAGMAGYSEEDHVARVKFGLELMGKNWTRAGFNCVPLVTRDLDATCSLDVLLLRPGPSATRHILNQGDIDGQLKTIIDALRIPDNGNETGNAIPAENEAPFFCSSVRLEVEQDQLVGGS